MSDEREPLWSDNIIHDEVVLRVREQKYWASAIKVAVNIRDEYEAHLAKRAISPDVRDTIRRSLISSESLNSTDEWYKRMTAALAWLDRQ